VQKGNGGEAQQAKHFKTLNELIAESNNPEAKALKQEIDKVSEERRGLIKELKNMERLMGYKMEEHRAITELLSSHQKELEESKRSIGKLKRMKRNLEFAIETEASSLEKEKALIRRIKETNTKLDDALMFIRLERKMNNIKGDIESYNTRIQETAKKVHEYDAKLDELYARMRSVLNIRRSKGQKQGKKEKPQPRQMPTINLEDIAVIKKKVE
jgi:uncharacterized coiled-coil DUF342 family protein